MTFQAMVMVLVTRSRTFLYFQAVSPDYCSLILHLISNKIVDCVMRSGVLAC